MDHEVITGKVFGVSGFVNDVVEDEDDGKVLHQMWYEDKGQEDLRLKDCVDVL